MICCCSPAAAVLRRCLTRSGSTSAICPACRSKNVLSANLMTGDCNGITDKTVAFLTRSPGDTAETAKAANWMKEQACACLFAVGKREPTLNPSAMILIVYGEACRNWGFYLLIGCRILYRSGSFDALPRFADELEEPCLCTGTGTQAGRCQVPEICAGLLQGAV